MEVSVLTCVKVVCREIQGFSAEQGILQRIEAFLDYAPQLGSFLACQSLPLRFVKRAFASQEWGHKELVHAFEASTEMGKLGVIVWLSDDAGSIEGLSLAAFKDRFPVVKWLVEHGAKPERFNEIDRSAFHLCAGKVNVEIIQYLVGNGADVELRGYGAKTILHFAAQVTKENIDLVRFLLDRGVQATATDTLGRTALHYASVAQNFDIVEYLLKGIFTDNVPPRADLQRTLLSAAKGNRVELLLYFIERGVDIRYKTFQGRTALHEAAGNGAVFECDDDDAIIYGKLPS